MRQKAVVGIFVMALVSFSALVYSYYHQQYKKIQENVVAQVSRDASHQLAYTEREYTNLKDQIVSVVGLLRNNQSLLNFISAPQLANRELVEEGWKTLLVNQKWYSQIRYIDLSGKEQINVEYSRSSNMAYDLMEQDDNIIIDDLLQYANSLPLKSIGSWQPIENSARESSYHPELKLVSPVSIDGLRVGYLIMDIDVLYLSSRLNYAPDHDFRPSLISENGFFLSDDDVGRIYRENTPDNARFNVKHTFPLSWQQAQRLPKGSLMEEGTLVVFNRVYMMPDTPFYLVVALNSERLKQRAADTLNDLQQQVIFILGVILLFSLPISSAMLHFHRRNVESKLARAALSGMSAVIITDSRHRVITVNNEFETLTGYSKHFSVGKLSFKLLFQETQLNSLKAIWVTLKSSNTWEGEVICYRENGDEITTIARVQAVNDRHGKADYYITSLIDITARKELENKLRMLSERDSLTQLWNRRKFEAELAKQAKLVERYTGSHFACLSLIDIDYFKRVNDEFGHDAGDNVIRLVGEFLQREMRSTDFVARVGGEEFALIMPHTRLNEAKMVLERVRQRLESNDLIPVTISIGVSDLNYDPTRSYKCADNALYASKTAGRNRVSEYRDPE